MTSAQELFNTAYRGVIAQGGPSANCFGNCKYRGPEGRKCGVGHCLTDEEAHTFEGKGWCGIRERAPKRLRPFHSLLVRIQGAHDDAAFYNGSVGFIDDFKERMEAVALKFNLTVPTDV